VLELNCAYFSGKKTKRQVLLPGGAGFIGSHCAIELIKAGYEPIIIDNGCNSSKSSRIIIVRIVY
jgi:UDP-glucose 4-epimerase